MLTLWRYLLPLRFRSARFSTLRSLRTTRRMGQKSISREIVEAIIIILQEFNRN